MDLPYTCSMQVLMLCPCTLFELRIFSMPFYVNVAFDKDLSVLRKLVGWNLLVDRY